MPEKIRQARERQLIEILGELASVEQQINQILAQAEEVSAGINISEANPGELDGLSGLGEKLEKLEERHKILLKEKETAQEKL